MPKELPAKPLVTLEKNYIFSENNLCTTARLDQGVYSEGDVITVSIQVRGRRKSSIRVIQFHLT